MKKFSIGIAILLAFHYFKKRLNNQREKEIEKERERKGENLLFKRRTCSGENPIVCKDCYYGKNSMTNKETPCFRTKESLKAEMPKFL
jgi:hypothetical protein